MKMTPEEARKLASELIGRSSVDGPTYGQIAQVILDTCTEEAADCEAWVQAERNRCIDAMRRADGMITRGRENAEAIIREGKPATDALEAKLREARLEEAEWWYQYAYWFKNKKPASACEERLAALKGAK